MGQRSNKAKELFTAAALFLTGPVWAASGDGREVEAQPNVDILGFTLHMTPEDVAREMEALGAILADEDRYKFSGTDIEFLASQRWALAEGGQMTIDYSRPPADPVVLGLARNFGPVDSLPGERLRAALQDKYGEPDFTREAAAGAVMVWFDGANIEQCWGVAPGNPMGADCNGPLLKINLSSRNGASGRISSPGHASLYDYADLIDNWDDFNRYGGEVARRVEEERMKESQAPSF